MLYIKNLSIGYDKKVVSENINLQLSGGEYLCILGENGSGKSTFIKTLLGLIQKISGNIEFTNNLNRDEIGYLSQEANYKADFPTTVSEVVISGCLNKMKFRPFYKTKEKEKMLKNLQLLEIENLKNKSFSELSGGQKQRVLLARALCATDKILVLDEPISALDPKTTYDFYNILEKLNKNGITIVMISHDIDMAVKYSTHILHLGKEKFFGTKDDYIKSEIGINFMKRSRGDLNG